MCAQALSLAFSHVRGHLRVSRVLLDGPRKRRDCLESIFNVSDYYVIVEVLA